MEDSRDLFNNNGMLLTREQTNFVHYLEKAGYKVADNPQIVSKIVEELTPSLPRNIFCVTHGTSEIAGDFIRQLFIRQMCGEAIVIYYN